MAINEETHSNTQKRTTKELREYQLRQQRRKEIFEATKAALQLVDLTKTETRTFTIFSKERLRTYMQNPKSNESNLRQLSFYIAVLTLIGD